MVANGNSNTIPGKNTSHPQLVFKVHRRRWLILIIFCFYSIANLLQLVLYSIIADVLMKYYGVSYTEAEWTIMTYTLGYLIFNFPGNYLLDKLGLRWSVIIGIIGTCVGSWVKVASIDPSRFWVLLLGQSISSIFQVLVTPLPAKIAAVWFGVNEVSRACSIAFIGTQVSLALGYLLPPLIVEGHNINEIEDGLTRLAYMVAIYSSLLVPIIILFFRNAPASPPSLAQLMRLEEKEKKSKFKDSLKELFSNRSFVIFVIMFGISWGIDVALSIMFNQIILRHHPGATKHVGFIGGISIGFGLLGCYIFGFLLDKFRKYKEISLGVVLLHSLAIIFFNSTLSFNVYFIYFTAILMNFLSLGGLVVAYELCVELTYPEPEGTSTGILSMSVQIFALAFTYIYTYLLSITTDLWANIILYAILLLSNCLFIFVKFDLRRQEIEVKTKSNNIDRIEMFTIQNFNIG